MHVRRVLLLFVTVLGLAALAAAVSQPRDDAREPRPPEPAAPTATPGPRAGSGLELEFPAGDRPATRRLESGRSATITVQVSRAGEVALEGLGLVAYAEPLTPARFEVLGGRPASYAVRFTPAGTSEAATIGTLAVVPASSRTRDRSR